MKSLLFGGIAAIVGGGVYLHGPMGEANVYAMPAAEAYQKLAAVKVEPSNTGPFGRLDTLVSGSAQTSVTFTASGAHAHIECVATIVPAGEEVARVDASCGGGGPSSGAAAGLESKMRRKAFIELLDSTLEDRAFDPDLARGATAAGWPEDVIDHGNYATAVSEAHRMHAETRSMIVQMEQEAPAAPAAGGWGEDTPDE